MRTRGNGTRRVTIVEVAALARVSTATVSRVLAASGPVAAERASRVRDAVTRLGYVPNEAARELSSRSPRPAEVGAAGETAARYLLGLGHRRVGFVAAIRDAAAAADYAAAVQRTFAAAGVDPALARASENDVAAVLRGWLGGPGRPTAVLCADDLLALAVVDGCSHLRVAVPAGLSVVGFGDQRWTAHVRPRLTTVRLQVGGGDREAWPCRLVVRQSTGPAPRD